MWAGTLGGRPSWPDLPEEGVNLLACDACLLGTLGSEWAGMPGLVWT